MVVEDSAAVVVEAALAVVVGGKEAGMTTSAVPIEQDDNTMSAANRPIVERPWCASECTLLQSLSANLQASGNSGRAITT